MDFGILGFEDLEFWPWDVDVDVDMCVCVRVCICVFASEFFIYTYIWRERYLDIYICLNFCITLNLVS